MTTIDQPPAGLEFKAPAAMLAPRPNTSVPDGGVIDVEPAGVVECLGAVTGVVDEVRDEIQPGAFRATLRQRRPKIIIGHDWSRLCGQVLDIAELMPGDPRLPRTAPDGTPWPPEAGALWLRIQYLMGTRDGRDQYEIAKVFGDEMAFSIGYKVRHARQRDGVRLIDDLDLYEVSGVLHGANSLARLTSVKSGRPAGLEIKVAGGVGTVSTSRTARVATGLRPCAICGLGAVKVPPGVSRHGSAAICKSCVDEAREALNVPAAAIYDQAVADEQEFDRLPDGSLTRKHPGRAF